MAKKSIIFLILLLVCFRLNAQNIITYAGSGVGGFSGDGGPATSAKISTTAYGGIFDKFGNYFFADWNNQRIRKINPAGMIFTVAGTGVAGYNGDGIQATAAQLNWPGDVKVDTSGNIYISDQQNNRIRKIDRVTGLISTFAGTGIAGYSGDNGLATNAELHSVGLMCIDKFENLYVVDEYNRRVRKINQSGIISTYVGSGTAGHSGDGGPATAAQISPGSLCSDTLGNLYVGDNGFGELRIAKVNLLGIITTFAGTDTGYVYNGDGISADSANFTPSEICVDNFGNIVIADQPNNRVRRIDIVTHKISTIAGTGVAGYSGDGGPATAAQLYRPQGVAYDLCGNLYIPEQNNRIRKVNYPPILTIPTISITGDMSKPVGSMVTINATVSDAGSSYVIHWMNKGVEFTTTTVPNVTYTKAAGIDTITARVVSTATYGCYDSTTSGGWVVTTSGVWISPQPSPKEREVL